MKTTSISKEELLELRAVEAKYKQLSADFIAFTEIVNSIEDYGVLSSLRQRQVDDLQEKIMQQINPA